MKTVSHYLSPIDKSKNVSILNFGSREELSSAGADVIVETVNDLKNLLSGGN